ncbi:MAG: extracellular solute-binding protein [Patescibacteria group bacterium]
MNLNKNQLIFIGVAGFIIVLIGLVFAGVLPGLRQTGGGSGGPNKIQAKLNFWGAGDKSDDYSLAISAFKTNYPNVEINYRSFNNFDDYQTALLDALAAGNGPDIFMIRNTDLPRNLNKIVAVPAVRFSLLNLRGSFPQIVESDFATQNALYALPLSIDTLAMIYNRDILASKGVALPPATWEDFKNDIPKLTTTDQNNKLLSAGAGIGTAKNIANAADILSFLMLQTGTQMTSADFRSATFASPEGLNALNFYTQFGNSSKKTYTWNNSFPDSIESFANEKVAMIFGYASDIGKIKERNAFLNFAVTPAPQPIEAKKLVTYGHYFGYAVSRQSRNSAIAWDFIIHLTTNEVGVNDYVLKTKKPPALLSLVNQYAGDPSLGVFAKQILTARSWPQIDADQISALFKTLIDSVIINGADPMKSLRQAQDSVSQLMAKIQ